MNVLIVEDELHLSREISEFLKKEHFNCDKAFNGKQASEKIAVNKYDFILLDLGLPDYEGLNLIREAKTAEQPAAIIILTARGNLDDKIKGLDSGADDYLAKPFALPELLARIKAISRRKFNLNNHLISLGDFVIDLDKYILTFKGQPITTTKKEFDLLSYLIHNKNMVLTRMQLTEHIWGNISEDDYDSNYIDVHIKNLRKKLSAYGDISWLETVRGIGYKVNTLNF
jgi:DNA-binding response OmpR family regulator